MKSSLTDFREVHELDKESAAELLQLSISTINRIEKGLTNIPLKCEPIIRGLDLDFDDLRRRQSEFIDFVRQEIFNRVRDRIRSSKLNGKRREKGGHNGGKKSDNEAD